MEGLRLSAGYCAWWEKTASADARVLKILARAGAVFHARTTEPQSMMHLETESNLYGATVNPYDTRLSAGGSSGGEGALVGARGSCLGIGTDIGGKMLALSFSTAPPTPSRRHALLTQPQAPSASPPRTAGSTA